MGEAKFTKGEWEELNGDGTQKELIITTNDRWNSSKGAICEMDVIFDGEYGIEQVANAHLIVAAPEMYKALIRIQQEGGLSVARHKSISGLLAKARGESQ